MIVRALRGLGVLAGVEIRRHRPVGRRRQALLADHGVGLVLDVGANVGAYGAALRRFGYRGKIVSFEPVGAAFGPLAARAAADGNWEAHQVALGATSSQMRINVASNLASSSLLPMREEHRRLAPDVSYVTTEAVRVSRLDDLVDEVVGPTLLKLDVQGFEDRVLAGAPAVLDRVVVIECELCVVPLYEGQQPLVDMLGTLRRHGFELHALEPGARDVAGAVAYYDAFLVRSR